MLGEVSVFDLSAELPENTYFRTSADYHCFPLLDIATIPKACEERIVNTVLEKMKAEDVPRKLYIHCCNGPFSESPNR